MENISHFLRACETPPLNLPSHDRFLTVDLYENKDPAQVIQCLGAFSRVANSISPSNFPTTIGPKKAGVTSPTRAGFGAGSTIGNEFGGLSSYVGNESNPALPPRNGALSAKALSPTVTGGSNSSKTQDGIPKSPPGSVSSWSKKSDEDKTAPAWNINQYGYMGGASQGNQGIAFGGRRQITSAGPHVIGVAERERRRKEEQEAERERLRIQEEEAERRRRVEQEAAEAKARREEEDRILEEERRQAEERRAEIERQELAKWQKEEEARRARELERQRAQEEERQWRLQEIRRREEEAERLQKERDMEERTKKEAPQKRPEMDTRLRGQFLSQYKAEQSEQAGYAKPAIADIPPQRSLEHDRLRELERQLEEAREREQQYIREREALSRKEQKNADTHENEDGDTAPHVEARQQTPDESDVSWVAGDERDYLRQQWKEHQNNATSARNDNNAYNSPLPTRSKPPAPTSSPAPPSTSRPLPDPKSRSPFHRTTRPLPVPSEADNPIPSTELPIRVEKAVEQSSKSASVTSSTPHRAPERGFPFKPGRVSAEARQNAVGQLQPPKPKTGGWASKSLLEREMERERERQREWEEAQKRTKEAQRNPAEGSGEGQSWDVNQYGWTGGDSQNKVGSGIGFGGRRQIIGPRPAP